MEPISKVYMQTVPSGCGTFSNTTTVYHPKVPFFQSLLACLGVSGELARASFAGLANWEGGQKRKESMIPIS